MVQSIKHCFSPYLFDALWYEWPPTLNSGWYTEVEKMTMLWGPSLTQHLIQHLNNNTISQIIAYQLHDFPGGPVVRVSPSYVQGVSSIPGRGDKILHALWPKSQNIKKQKQYCNKFNKDLIKRQHTTCSQKAYKIPLYLNRWDIDEFWGNSFIRLLLTEIFMRQMLI